MKTASGQALVRAILEHALDYEWSLQGFGMLRLYLSKAVRLHVWDPTQAVENVSVIHDHPWDFTSEVVCGEIRNVVYLESDAVLTSESHMIQRIICGPGGHAEGAPRPVHLTVNVDRTYRAGESYYESAERFHESCPTPGTVTLVTREFREDTEHAQVCFPIGTSWVSAEPRRATDKEILRFTRLALARLGESTG